MTVCHVGSGSCRVLEEDSRHYFSFFGDNFGKSAPDASICSLKRIFTAQTPAVSSSVIKFDCPCMYKRTKGESVLYEPEGDHLGWPTSCPIFHSPNVQLHTNCQVPLYSSPWLNLALVSHTVVISTLWWWFLFCSWKTAVRTTQWSFSSTSSMDNRGLDRSSGTQVTDRLCGARCHFITHRSAGRKEQYLKRHAYSTYSIADDICHPAWFTVSKQWNHLHLKE